MEKAMLMAAGMGTGMRPVTRRRRHGRTERSRQEAWMDESRKTCRNYWIRLLHGNS